MAEDAAASSQGDGNPQDVRDKILAAHAAVDADRLPMWTVLGPGTSDHPGWYLARLFISLPEPKPTDILVRAGSLDEIRSLLPPGLTCLTRPPQDDPNIIETWF